jgi:hypothetical protein
MWERSRSSTQCAEADARPKDLDVEAPYTVGREMPREEPRPTGRTVAEQDSSVGAHPFAERKDHAGASLRMTVVR